MHREVPPDNSIAVGRQAAKIAANALSDLGRAMIQQKALDVARQIEIYLQHRPFSSLADLKHDAELASIAVSKIGQSGFTAVHDTQAVNFFHHDPGVIGKDLHQLAYVFPQFWQIVERGLSCEADGYYDWPEADGLIHRKYMYCAPLFPPQIAPAGLVVAATISMDEFLQPSREISERIITLAERVDEYHRAEQRRMERLRAINRMSRRISSYLDAQELLPYVTHTIADAFQVQSVRIFLLGTGGQLELAAQSGELPCRDDAEAYPMLNPCIAETVAITGKYYLSEEGKTESMSALDGQADECRPARMVVPIKLGRTTLGVLDLIDGHAKGFRDIDLFSIWPLADQVATALENARLHRELRETAVVEERNRIAREIHDTLAQGFAGIAMLTESAKQALKEDAPDEAGQILDRIRVLAKDKLSEARRSVQALRPNIVIQENLETLIRGELAQLAKDAPLDTHLEVIGEEPAVAQATKLALLRICQEALHNIQKHANASHVDAVLTYSQSAVTLVVRDDGAGFNARTPTSNTFGLSVMRERARLAGGSVVVDSQIGAGTKVFVNIPL